ncbi:unnamed protein product [Chironomus riparius]|uniref:Uncharacterized protein n=1 Tax=Chironomus riparius TaxID=315576 RepID=A0A9P0J4P6_9DIPT|nr:unnamed protein product [Chironomus riparius]
MAAEYSNAYKINSHSKSSTKSRFWNRSFHILSSENKINANIDEMKHKWSHSLQMNFAGLYNNKSNGNENDENNKKIIINNNNSENIICRLDRKEKYAEFNIANRSRCNWKSFLASIIIVLLHLTTSVECLQARQEASSNCVFPQQWEGSWFQSGVPQTINIQGSKMSNRGDCIASDGDKFLMRDKRCHRCVVIYEKHKNVLQYKESECEEMDHFNPSALSSRSIIKSDQIRGVALSSHSNMSGKLSASDQLYRSHDDRIIKDDCMGCRGRETLQNLCDQIPGDALLYSMFKVDADPIKCPIKGSYLFTYNRGHGECKSPVSNVESCTEDSRMLLSFQACPDVPGTESTVEELTCLATWKDGNARFLVGLISHNHATSNEERYRCFVYEKISGKRDDLPKDAEYKLAQSGDATCNGLESAEVGSRIMTLRKAPPVERCDFPSWIRHQKHWHTLSGSVTYTFHQNDGSMHIVKQNGYLETRVLCEQINKQTPNEMMAVVEKTTGCKSRFVCVMFYRRSPHVAELQMGIPTDRLEHACAMNHSDTSRLPFITLLASNPDPEICPLDGSYTIRGLISPPYSTSRHKRNHNSKLHNNHHHLLHDLSSLDGSSNIFSSSISRIAANNNFKAHTSLSFRNEDDSLKSWHLNDRNKSLRQRRSPVQLQQKNEQHLRKIELNESDSENSIEIAPRNAFIDVSDDGSDVTDINNDEVIKLVRNKRNNNDNLDKISNGLDIMSNDGMKANSNDPSRSRRDTTINCGSSVNTKSRQLNIGCSVENKIDVSPQCIGNDDMEEEYTCHGSWRENQTTFIIARHTKYVVCISFKQLTTDTAQLYIGDSCFRENQSPEVLAERQYSLANLTNVGHQCGDINSSIKLKFNWHILSLAFIPWLSMYFKIIS